MFLWLAAFVHYGRKAKFQLQMSENKGIVFFFFFPIQVHGQFPLNSPTLTVENHGKRVLARISGNINQICLLQMVEGKGVTFGPCPRSHGSLVQGIFLGVPLLLSMVFHSPSSTSVRFSLSPWRFLLWLFLVIKWNGDLENQSRVYTHCFLILTHNSRVFLIGPHCSHLHPVIFHMSPLLRSQIHVHSCISPQEHAALLVVHSFLFFMYLH